MMRWFKKRKYVAIKVQDPCELIVLYERYEGDSSQEVFYGPNLGRQIYLRDGVIEWPLPKDWTEAIKGKKVTIQLHISAPRESGDGD